MTVNNKFHYLRRLLTFVILSSVSLFFVHRTWLICEDVRSVQKLNTYEGVQADYVWTTRELWIMTDQIKSEKVDDIISEISRFNLGSVSLWFEEITREQFGNILTLPIRVKLEIVSYTPLSGEGRIAVKPGYLEKVTIRLSGLNSDELLDIFRKKKTKEFSFTSHIGFPPDRDPSRMLMMSDTAFYEIIYSRHVDTLFLGNIHVINTSVDYVDATIKTTKNTHKSSDIILKNCVPLLEVVNIAQNVKAKKLYFTFVSRTEAAQVFNNEFPYVDTAVFIAEERCVFCFKKRLDQACLTGTCYLENE